jgi:hypothetical protein
MVSLTSTKYTDENILVIKLDFWGTEVTIKINLPELVVKQIIDQNRHLL